MKNAKKLIALLLALVMALSLVACNKDTDAAPDTDTPDGVTDDQSSSDTPDVSTAADPTGYTVGAAITPEELGSGTVKWSEETTSDGWVRVTNEGGKTLGYSPDSGVSLIQVDGFAFKDLDRDGELDVYEDWRNDTETRAADLAAHMTGEEIAPMLTHGGWSSFGRTIDGSDLEYIQAGGRGGVTRSAGVEGNTTMAVTWSNALQATCEATGSYGIPATVSIDPNHISGLIDQLALGATMDTELAFQVGVEMSKQYRSVGIQMLLGPQIDIATQPTLDRFSGTYGEDPALSRDITKAFVSGMQSTWSDSGSDEGWGEDSVACVMKHFVAAGAAEGGRNDHGADGKYDVFPGNNFGAHLIPFFDGAFNLDSKTGVAAAVMTNYSVSYSATEQYGELVAGAYSEYKHSLLRDNGWDGFIVTDWGIVGDGDKIWGVEDLTTAERTAMMFRLGASQIGGSTDVDTPVEAYDLLIDELGEDEALRVMRLAAYRFFVTQFNCNLFENPYITMDNATALAWSAESNAYGLSTQEKAVIMLKNSDNTIAAENGKKTVYVPYAYNAGSEATASAEATPASWSPVMDLTLAGNLFNVVTDTVGEPTGDPDADGNPTYTENDIIRASASDLAACDLALVVMNSPRTASAQDADGNWLPASIQYGEYTATKARSESIAGDFTVETIPDGYYGSTTRETKENRSYNGNTVGRADNYGDLELLQTVSGLVPDSCKVVVLLYVDGPMVLSEVEPLADAILVFFSSSGPGTSAGGEEALLNIVSGKVEPSALLPFQMPASMDAVEVQQEDVPRDCECYVDADGNTYDFTFGMNWSGVINDARVQTYSAAPLTTPETISYK